MKTLTTNIREFWWLELCQSTLQVPDDTAVWDKWALIHNLIHNIDTNQYIIVMLDEMTVLYLQLLVMMNLDRIVNQFLGPH